MITNSEILNILSVSPSVELLRLKNRDTILIFLLNVFSDRQTTISSENIHNQLADFLEFKEIEQDEDSDIDLFDSYEQKAKKYLTNWTNKGFLSNYQHENGEIFYELSSHSNKTIDWLSSLKKEEYIGTESKLKNIFNQLKELVEFTNDDAQKRIALLESKKMEIEQQIHRIQAGEDIKVFEEFEITPRFKQLNQLAKELLSDFKEVEDNFKEIIKNIHQKQIDDSLSKSDILEFSFDALNALKASSQGKSFYAFWSFLLDSRSQEEWEYLTEELYKALKEKNIEVSDFFLKRMKNHLHTLGQKVYKSNDKMAEKLSRIIRENDSSKSEATKNLLLEIKKSLLEISKSNNKPEISLLLETDSEINIPFERKLTFEQTEQVIYQETPSLAEEDILNSQYLHKLFTRSNINKDVLRQRIKNSLNTNSQTTIGYVIAHNGGIKNGLAELFGYIGIVKEFKHSIHPEKKQSIVFNNELKKSIQIPEIILTK